MTLPFIDTNMPDQLISALCNTLMHSLWQGVLLAAIAGLIVICTRKASSALRYNLLISALSLFAVAVAVTFVWQYKKTDSVLATTVITPPFQMTAPVVHAAAPAVKAATAISVADRFSNYLNTHHDTIILIWFLIVCMRCLQLGFGLYGTYRLKRTRVFAVKAEWQQRMQQLALALGIRQTITLLESGLAKVPMVIGTLKPVILVPIGLLTALSAEEVEAILIHELAHIKRRDYLVNVLQSLMEIVFFFNPAVLWVSKLIKTERENCCDDLAIAQNNNKVNYIRALVSCEEYQATVPAYAMAFSGNRNTLLNRVKRMAGNHNHSLNLFEKTVLAICLVAFGLGVSAFTARRPIQKALKSVATAIHIEPVAQKAAPVKGDTTKKKRNEPLNNINVLLNKLRFHADTLKMVDNGPLSMINHKLDSLRVGKENAGSTLLLAKPDTNPLKTLRMMNKGSFDAMHDIGLELYRERLITDTNHLSISLNERELIVNGVRMSGQVHQRLYNKFGRKGESGSYSSSYTGTPPGYTTGYGKYDTSYSAKTNAYSSSYPGPGVNYSTDSGSYGATSKNYQRENEERQKYWAGQQKKIIADLLKDGLITDPKNMSFSMSDRKFIVNGKRQSDEVYKRYKDKYMHNSTGTGWNWNYSTSE